MLWVVWGSNASLEPIYLKILNPGEILLQLAFWIFKISWTVQKLLHFETMSKYSQKCHVLVPKMHLFLLKSQNWKSSKIMFGTFQHPNFFSNSCPIYLWICSEKKSGGEWKGFSFFAFYIKNNLLILCFVLLLIWELQISNNFTPKYCFQSFCWIFIYITMTCSWAIKNKKRKGIFSYEKWKLSPANFLSKNTYFFWKHNCSMFVNFEKRNGPL